MALGPCVWTREHVFRFGGTLYHQHERFYVARVAAFTPQALHLEADEARSFRGLRWWSLQEIETAAIETAPRDLARLVRTLLEDGTPDQPVVVGV